MSERGPTTGSLPPALEEAVLGILDGDEAARDAALADLLRTHPAQARAIRSWLSAAGVALPPEPGGGAAAPPGADPGSGGAAGEPDIVLPQVLGPYVLQELLGRGGFGTVYRAEQQEPMRRAVAIKVVNPGMDSREILSRFAAEREALNRMDHPGIARLLDAGTTGRGRPFFVMELVEGPTLVAYCRQRRLPLRSRLQLFLLVLDAMQHAHQKSVLHRDLSSNNVLIADPDGRPQPKIIDFGIAKSLRDPLLQGAALTFQGTLMGTPEFMSPEQASGRLDDLDTRADVYALGVQLYELLADQLPIPGVTLRSQGIAGMAEVVRCYQPVPPSDAAPRERRAQLRGDLDAIAMKALAKARDERYGGVGEFAADLRRHLADLPVQVAAPSTWHRLRKFVRRNRAQSVAVGIVCAGLLAALLVMASSLQHAQRSAREAEEARAASAAKADAGFLLLANEERLAAAMAAERQLGPPWPEHAEAYERWRQQHEAPLLLERDKLRARLAALLARPAAAGGAPAGTGGGDDFAARHLERALGRLELQFDAFLGDAGPAAQVQRRQRLLQQTIAPALVEHGPEWRAATAAIMKSDDRLASRDYRGLQLPVLPGLVPVGADPRTKLWEFVDLHTHEPGYPLPARDPATGELAADAGTGVVFVLLPGRVVDLGARGPEAGSDRRDDLAAAEELRGGSVALDAFLIARTELTQAQWRRLAGPAHRADDPLLPAAGVDWQLAREVLARFGACLPTEAQWEYAARGGTAWPWSSGPEIDAVAGHGWFTTGPQPVGLLPPNGYGLFDVHGNVAEWCEDEKLPYVDFAPRRGDGLRARTGAALVAPVRAVRGGAWHQGPVAARVTARDGRPADWRDGAIGLRPVRRLRAE